MLPYTTYLIDLDGVIYRGNELLPGAKEFIAWLEAHKKRYLFLTNNSFATGAQILAKLTRLGIAADADHHPLGRVPVVDRVPVRLQVLRRHLGVRQPRAAAVAGAHRRAPVVPRAGARDGRRTLLRQQLLRP